MNKYIKNIKFTENGYNADYITAEEICDDNPLLKIVYDFIYGTEKLGPFGALHETKFVMKGQD